MGDIFVSSAMLHGVTSLGTVSRHEYQNCRTDSCVVKHRSLHLREIAGERSMSRNSPETRAHCSSAELVSRGSSHP